MEIKNESLAKHSSLRVGEMAEIFTPKNYQELQQFLQHNKKKVFLLGLGSNTLFTNNFNAVAIKTYKLKNIELHGEQIIVDVGTTLKKLADFAKQNNIKGANWIASIPGTVGGALRMNAGCFGREFWQHVKSVNIITSAGRIYQKDAEEFNVAYRKAEIKENEFFLNCKLDFAGFDDVDQDLVDSRYNSQPIGTANCGSVFKNPDGMFAAKLIEDSGLKGKCIGGACISKKHANFIINTGNATSQDVVDLIKHIKQTVYQKFAVTLEEEVIIK